ncbi:MAG: hypothetical protein GTO02_06830 [Candidatus Dadabacteria bacterium]|nr:hypothetical protein [Candidatus Dadabacteria bacterium]NIQ14112.1 hypothetical protein [Candidatus Dadabacteria bacterium]
MVIVVSGYIAYPYFFERFINNKEEVLESEYSKLLRLENLKKTYMDEIRDIEFDYGLGKLSKSDYDELLSKYKIKAANVLKAIDNFNKKSDKSIDIEIERKISAQRKTNS